MFNIFKNLFEKMFNTSFLKNYKSTANNEIIFHKNITIISNYFVKCFSIELYYILKENTNREIIKSNIRSIFNPSVNLHIYNVAKEQSKSINYINDTVANKDYNQILDKILNLSKQYNNHEKENKNFDEVLFNFMDMLLEYCGLKNEYTIKENKDKLINILLREYIRKHKPKRLNFLTKAKTIETNTGFNTRINSLRKELKTKNKKIVDLIHNKLGFYKTLDNPKIDINKYKEKNSLEKLYKKMYVRNSLLSKGNEAVFNKFINKLKNIALPVARTLDTVLKATTKTMNLVLKVSKLIGLSNILKAEKQRIKIKTRTTERTTERTRETEIKTTKDKEQKPEEQKQQSKEKQEPKETKQPQQESQKPAIDNNQPQPNKENEKRQEQQEKQNKQPEQQKQNKQPEQQEETKKQQKESEERTKNENPDKSSEKDDLKKPEREESEINKETEEEFKDKSDENGVDEDDVFGDENEIDEDGLGDESLEDLLNENHVSTSGEERINVILTNAIEPAPSFQIREEARVKSGFNIRGI